MNFALSARTYWRSGSKQLRWIRALRRPETASSGIFAVARHALTDAQRE